MRVRWPVLLVSIALTAAAHADAPVAPSWSVGVGPVAELIPSSTAGALGTIGAELDVGKRTSNLYLGVTSELSYVFGPPSLMGADFSAGVPHVQARVGFELRYALFSWDGGWSCDGYQMPGSFWLGLRAGPENVDGTFGGFGDFSVGYDHWYLSAGFSVDPAGTYGQAVLMGQPVAGSAGAVTPFMGSGIRLVFD